MNLWLRTPPQQQSFTLARPRALIAAAESGPQVAAKNKSGSLRRLAQDWQLRAFNAYDQNGECWYPAQFYARSLQKTRLFPALLNERGEPEEQTTGPLVDLWERVQDPGGGRSQLLGAYGRLQFLTGDGYLTVTEDEDGEEAWEYLSVVELKIDPAGRPGDPQRYRRIRAPGASPEELLEADDTDFEPLGNKARVWRLWRRHPQHTDLADAPIKAVLDAYELLQRLTMAAGAEAQSRAAQRGLLLVAEEIANQFGLVGADDDPESDPFLRALGEALESALANPGTAQSAAPIVLRGPASVPNPGGGPAIPLKDLVTWIPLGPSERYFEGEMWDKTIARIGNGLDLPKTILTGEAKNHWGDWIVDEQGYRQHVAPVTQSLCDDLASAYLRPAAREEGFADWQRAAVGYDPAEAINHPDQTGVAKDAHDRFVISDQAYRDVAGFTDDDAPDDAELARRIDIAIRRRAVVPPQVADAPVSGGETPPGQGGRGGDTQEQPPASPASGQNGNGSAPAAVAAAALQTAKIVGAAELQVERARELAGQRLIRRSQSCADCKERIKTVPAGLVASALGADTVREIIDGHTSENALVAGVGSGLAGKLRDWGLDGEWPDQLGRLVEAHALRTLYEQKPPPLPPAFAATIARAVR